MQGKKDPDRLGELQSCWTGFEAVLGVLGLWVGQPEDVLQSMKQLALHRCTVNLLAHGLEVWCLTSAFVHSKDYRQRGRVVFDKQLIGLLPVN